MRSSAQSAPCADVHGGAQSDAVHTTNYTDTFIAVAEDCHYERLVADPSLSQTRAMRSRRA